MMRTTSIGAPLQHTRFGSVYEFKAQEGKSYTLIRAYCDPNEQPKLYQLLEEAERKNPDPEKFNLISTKGTLENPADDVAMLILHTPNKRIIGLTQTNAYQFQALVQKECSKPNGPSVSELLEDYLNPNLESDQYGIDRFQRTQNDRDKASTPHVIEINDWADLLPQKLKDIFKQI